MVYIFVFVTNGVMFYGKSPFCQHNSFTDSSNNLKLLVNATLTKLEMEHGVDISL